MSSYKGTCESPLGMDSVGAEDNDYSALGAGAFSQSIVGKLSQLASHGIQDWLGSASKNTENFSSMVKKHV